MTMNDLSCDDVVARLPLLIIGDLPSGEEAEIEHHAETCRECKGDIAESRRLSAALDHLAQDPGFGQRVAGVMPALRERLLSQLPRQAAYERIDSPLGPLFLVVSASGLCGVRFDRDEKTVVEWSQKGSLAPMYSAVEVAPFARQLHQYFAGERRGFDLPVDLSLASPFAREVLNATRQVPFGRLATYRSIAQDVGKPGATRAVGNALGSNPVPIVIPCHRVIRSDGSLGGYTGGLDIKRHLLSLEGALLAT